MRIYREEHIRNFEFWQGARDFAEKLTDSQFDIIEDMLNDIYPEGLDETSLNDIFWFEKDSICEWLGYDSYDQFLQEKINQ